MTPDRDRPFLRRADGARLDEGGAQVTVVLVALGLVASYFVIHALVWAASHPIALGAFAAAIGIILLALGGFALADDADTRARHFHRRKDRR